MARMSDDRHMLRRQTLATKDVDRPEEKEIYTWYSPLGANTYAAAHMQSTMKRPMKMEYL